MVHWPHSPLHLFNAKGSYMITGATLYKNHFFNSVQKLNLLQHTLFDLALKYGWRLEAWAIFPNHYHFIAQSPEDPSTLRKMITHFY